MKFVVVASLAFLSGAYAESTITCSGCPSAVTTPDIVTRSALPTVSCTDKPLKIVTDTKGTSSGMAAPTGSDSGSGPMPTPTQVPVSGASVNKMGGAGMAVAAAVAAVYLL
ncbi:hypothetical protein SNK03_010878 [Fusarium graminearum]|uniref:Chromosome 3, complete genome n=2 Tax=Gibberella zeae TaxID=5518 RepID=I1RLZ9_GIBZE|nr:hypothetical protein FGSG_04971 [Fusarium graminearum PH-1]EYB29221.1 hypothetical protein FG05_04971 [Fusarium graminearum]ESU10870.1 hypothetical protein FGSG_04971 [Fusarium graminearum PH-1]KAI6757886.1 hypothetical protein HG531_003711 [Fusarium graminearum]PCD39843.1 hypothetical protein FGRA07_01114 [Fusarium graminearum]CAF3478609.1 unnamed protein product [Fusarium graminearum]|eukprot:XP_011323446.1 hypothetical protein FGSG_04971 [Fusarium graminearum PH-1]